jgi:hypothetical protein
VILIDGAPPGATLKLLRGNQVVNSTVTGPIGGSVVTMTDEKAPPGLTTYRVMQVQTGKPDALLAQADVSVPAPSVPEQPAPPIGATTATTFTADLFGRLGPQFAALAATAPARAAAQPVPLSPAAPVAGALAAPGAPATGNQVTLNQFFGRTKLPGPQAQAASDRPWFSLFHRTPKERPKTRIVDVTGVNAGVPVGPPSNPSGSSGVGTTVPNVLRSTPATPSTKQPAMEDDKIPGTGG